MDMHRLSLCSAAEAERLKFKSSLKVMRLHVKVQ
jgi:hypothetical protein